MFIIHYFVIMLYVVVFQFKYEIMTFLKRNIYLHFIGWKPLSIFNENKSYKVSYFDFKRTWWRLFQKRVVRT